MDGPHHLRSTNPVPDGFPRVFTDLELHRSFSLALDDRGTTANAINDHEIGHHQADEIAAAQFAVDGKVEQRQIPEVAR